MGRRPTLPGAVPRLRIRRNAIAGVRYYYDHGLVAGRRVLEPLGRDRVAALRRWAEIEGLREPHLAAHYTLHDVIVRYRAGPLQERARETQRKYVAILDRLDAVWGKVDIERITPADVRTWYDLTKVRRGLTTANHAKALLSRLLNYARETGLTAVANPCAGILGTRSRGRKAVLVTDAQFAAVYQQADQLTRWAMRLADLTALRPGDLVRLERANIVEGCLVVQMRKTSRPVAILIEGALAELVDELLAFRGSRIDICQALLRDETGEPATQTQLDQRFRRARARAGLQGAVFQFRDIRARAATRASLRQSMEAAQRLLGHATPQQTAGYVRAGRPARPA